MYVQLTRARYQPGKLDEAVAIIRDSVLPAAREQQGFRSAYFAIDRETNTGVGISLWETKADVEAIATSGFYQEQVGKMASLLVGSPQREIMEVALQV